MNLTEEERNLLNSIPKSSQSWDYRKAVSFLKAVLKLSVLIQAPRKDDKKILEALQEVKRFYP